MGSVLSCTLLDDKNTFIRSFSADGFLIEGKWYKESLCIIDGQVFLGSFSLEKFPDGLSIFEEKKGLYDIIFLGCGNEMKRMPSSFFDFFEKLGVVVDVMNTRSACGAFNFLKNDGRNPAALLLWEVSSEKGER